ncbi:MAG: hypothetical protein WBC91_14465 [Phototrophicaceae bacterium]
MTSYQQKSATEWTWQTNTKHHSVRYFESTQKLIWSGWVESSQGTVFEDGFAQPVQNFLQDGAPDHINVPESLVVDLKIALSKQQEKPKKNWFKWFIGIIN